MKQQLLIKYAKEMTGFNNQELATFLKCSIHTVKSWQRPEFNLDGDKVPDYRPMSDQTREYIALKLKELEQS